MMRVAPVLTALDHGRISSVINDARTSWRTFRPYLNTLCTNLDAARVVPGKEVPPYVITMNTVFDIQHVRTGIMARHTLVYPGSEPSKDGDMSILSTAGIAFLGAAVGDIVSWTDGELIGTAYVRNIVYQPEAAGDFDR
jgi:regulator of nucleoside diphosphate kinase